MRVARRQGDGVARCRHGAWNEHPRRRGKRRVPPELDRGLIGCRFGRTRAVRATNRDAVLSRPRQASGRRGPRRARPERVRTSRRRGRRPAKTAAGDRIQQGRRGAGWRRWPRTQGVPPDPRVSGRATFAWSSFTPPCWGTRNPASSASEPICSEIFKGCEGCYLRSRPGPRPHRARRAGGRRMRQRSNLRPRREDNRECTTVGGSRVASGCRRGAACHRGHRHLRRVDAGLNCLQRACIRGWWQSVHSI